MKQQRVADLTPRAHVESTFLVQSKERKISSNGSPYLDLALRDSSGVIPAKLWDSDRHNTSFEADEVVKVVGEVQEYRGSCQIRVHKIAKCAPEEVDPRDYLPRSRTDPQEMYASLLARIDRVSEGPIKALLLAILGDPSIAEKFKLAPAASSFHHAYLGGLLEHVCSLIGLGDKVCDHYPSLSRDLVLAGLILHDLGKIDELSYTAGFRYTTRGQLLGHIAIGLQTVHEKMGAIPDFPPSLRDQIEHILLSHHGKLEFGSPKEPMFPEALLVHYLDDLDSKLESMRAQYEAERQRGGDWTTRNRPLGRELLKPPREEIVAAPSNDDAEEKD